MVSDALATCPGSGGRADGVGSGAVPAARPGSPRLPFPWAHGAALGPSTFAGEAAPPSPCREKIDSKTSG